MKKYFVLMVLLAVACFACSKQKMKDDSATPVDNSSEKNSSKESAFSANSDRENKGSDQNSPKCTLDKKCSSKDEALVIEEGKCTLENKCKPAVEPLVVEEEKECRFENKCKPKEEPMAVEEEKECTLPKCQTN